MKLAVNIGEAREQLLRLYGIEAQLSELPGELDANFLALTHNGARLVLKIMHAGCNPQTVDFQCQAMIHLAARTTDLNLPTVQPTLDGEPYCCAQVAGEPSVIWLLRYCPGELLADFAPHTDALMSSFGAMMGRLDNGLASFQHPAMRREHHWELTRALHVRPLLEHIQGDSAAHCATVFQRFEQHVANALAHLPSTVIHNDANDYNVLVDWPAQGTAQVNGLFDFGDMTWQPTVCEVAVALTYAIMGKDVDPLLVCAAFLRGYHAQRTLSAAELAVLFDLICMRLAVSIATSSARQIDHPDDPYITISQQPAKAALASLSAISPALALCVFREACGLTVLGRAPAVAAWLSNPALSPAKVIASQVTPANETGEAAPLVLDLSVGSRLLGADPDNAELARLSALIDGAMARAGTDIAYGRWGEARPLYNGPAFGGAGYPLAERRTQHLGVDVFCTAGTPVHAPLDGRVVVLTNNAAPYDYGPMVVLEHQTATAERFYTLYGHLGTEVLSQLALGQQVTASQQIASVGAPPRNGNWPPHLHLQLILDLLGLDADFPGVGYPSQSEVWLALSPNPAVLLGVAPALLDARPITAQLQHARAQLLPSNLSLSYERPLHIVRGYRQFLYDAQGQAYLDVYNNIAHVGHSHPHVIEAVQSQIALLNTNTRYLHESILQYADRLTATLPDPLSVCFFVNSASEANELALRLARTYTGHNDMLVMEAAYHGHTSSLIDMSPYKHAGPGGQGRPAWVHEVILADDYRGPFKRRDPQAGEKYAAHVLQTLQAMAANGRRCAGYIAETLPSVGGQIVLPPGYLQAAYAHVRAHGGLTIADEVQVGFGRLGNVFWGFEDQQVVPDIVVLGKPIANGFPMGAVVTSPAIASAFDTGMEFFASFGGNPVACAAALAVLDVLEQENLQARAADLGQRFIKDLAALKERHPLVGDVRGRGLFVGIELVGDRQTLAPAAWEASYVVNRLRERQILAGTDGPMHNVLKIRPSMVVEMADLDYVTAALDQALGELAHRTND